MQHADGAPDEVAATPPGRSWPWRRTALLVSVALLVGLGLGVTLRPAASQPRHGSSRPGRVLLPNGRAAQPYPGTLVAAYRTSSVSDAGCPLRLGRGAGTPRFLSLPDSFVVTYPGSGLTVVFGDDAKGDVPEPDTLGPSVATTTDHLLVYEAAGTGYLFDDAGCVVTASVLRRPRGGAEASLVPTPAVVDYLASMRPVAGTVAPPAPPAATLSYRLQGVFGDYSVPSDCGEADLDVQGALATPGCEGLYWQAVDAVQRSNVVAWVDQYATAADATYQYGIEKRYMRQYAGTEADTTLRGVPRSQFILTNRGQLCEASFVAGRTVVRVEASAMYGDHVEPLACAKARTAAVRARTVVLTWQQQEPDGPLS